MSNCIIYAFFMLIHLGGYLVVRRSSYGWWPHMFWSPDMVTLFEYAPEVKSKKWFPPLLFKGVVKVVKLGKGVRP